MSLLAVFVLLKTYNVKTNFKKEVTLLLCFSILVTWFNSKILITIGIFSYIITCIWIFSKGITLQNLTKVEKANLIILGFFSSLGMLFSFMSWSLATFINIAMVVPIILYLYTSITTKLKFFNDYLFLSILVLDCISRFMKLF